MTLLRIELQLQSPTCIGQRPTSPGQLTTTAGYLSGTAVRGGLASLWLAGRRYEQLDEDEQRRFRQLFLEGAVTFGNAWPLYRDTTGRDWRTWIVPQSAWTEKRSGGWMGDRKSGVQDVLKALLNRVPLSDALDKLDRVGTEFTAERGGRWIGLAAKRRLITRSALTRNESNLPSVSRSVVVAGQLYSFEALEAGQRFAAVVSGDDGQIDILTKQLEPGHTLLSLGQGRSRGMGRVLVRKTTVLLDEARSMDDLAGMARKFTERTGLIGGSALLPVTLEADVILRDHYLLPCSSGDPLETLSRYLPGVPPTMRLLYALQSTHWLGGWDELGVFRAHPNSRCSKDQCGSIVYQKPSYMWPWLGGS
ncbi:MAG: hypothetical protein IPO81_00605 [Kouleothrix sp.]|nr:hypothetical protein [Kouleothrix sp.]